MDPSTVAPLISRRFGPTVRLLYLVIYKDYVLFAVQNPMLPDQLDEYALRHGTIGEGRARSFSGTAQTLTSYTYPLDQYPIGRTQHLVSESQLHLANKNYTDGNPIHVIMGNWTIINPALKPPAGIQVKVYFNSERKGTGVVSYDEKGSVKQIMAP